MTKFSEELDVLDEDSERYQYIGSVLADARQLAFDVDGRITLPPDLAAYAGITTEAAFLGQGKFFQIREPGAARAHVEATLANRKGGRGPGAAP